MVRPSADHASADISDDLSADDLDTLTEAAADAADATVSAVTAHADESAVITLSEDLDASQSQTLLDTLVTDPAIESVEPDIHVTLDDAPNDPYWSRQWDMTGSTGGMRAEQAWSTSTGSGVTVAIIDSGITAHPDLDSQEVPGYDFISDTWVANDGNGRDSDPTDAGDWTTAGQCGNGNPRSDQSSSWHGTHVAGTIAAASNNGIGVAGVAPDAKILPLRALGRCGGSSADIIDALTWATGGRVPGMGTNPNPATVVNMSLGGNGSCPAYYQRAIDAAVGRGATIVVAAGNDSIDASRSTPANCRNVVVVGSTGATAQRAYYSNYGSTVDLSAPGGDVYQGQAILSTVNSGTTTPAVATYGYMQGTSQATPHVAGTAALLMAANPSLTPEQVRSTLLSTVKPLRSCDRYSCGAGILDAAAAVQAVRRG